jgi:hypothetical protein
MILSISNYTASDDDRRIGNYSEELSISIHMGKR